MSHQKSHGWWTAAMLACPDWLLAVIGALFSVSIIMLLMLLYDIFAGVVTWPSVLSPIV